MQKILHQITVRLAESFDNAILCQQYARWMVMALCKQDITQLMVEKNFTLTCEQQAILDCWLTQLIDQHKPIQYVLGTVPFLDLTLAVEPPVLIPRPETEEWVAALCKQLHALPHEQPFVILDLCTGSGCVALALAAALPHATVYAVDIAPYAVALARRNAASNKISNVVFIEADLFAAFAQQNISFDLIVANPPYIAYDEWQQLDISVYAWEDARALTAADNGLAVIKDIIRQAPGYLHANQHMQRIGIPQLVIEIDRTQAAVVERLLQAANFMHTQIHQDFFGQDRVVSARL